MEIMIVIFGGLYLLIRIVGEEAYGQHLNNKREKCKWEHERIKFDLVNDEAERETEEFLNRAFYNQELLGEAIGDNLTAIYGSDYWDKFEKTRGGCYSRDLSYGTSALVKCLLMSKKGYIPKYFYDHGWSLYYFPGSSAELENKYIRQIQKNLDLSNTGVKLVYCQEPYGGGGEIKVKWKHDFIDPTARTSLVKY